MSDRVSEGSRIRYLDLAKGIGILLVIAEHWIGAYNYTFSNLVCSFHMPLFFVIGGMLYKEQPIENLLVRRAKTIMIPYIAFRTADAVWKTLITALPIPYSEKILRIVSLSGGTWFLIAFFLVSVLFPVLKRIAKDKWYFLLSLVLAVYLLGIVTSSMNIPISNTMKNVCVGMLFYYLGYELNQFEIDQFIEKSAGAFKIAVSLAAIGIILFCAYFKNDFMVLMYKNEYGDPILFTLKAILCSFALIVLCISMRRMTLLEKLGQLSMLIMIIQFPVYQSLEVVFNRISHYFYNGSLIVCLHIVFIMIVAFISWVLAALIERRWPALAGHWPK